MKEKKRTNLFFAKDGQYEREYDKKRYNVKIEVDK